MSSFSEALQQLKDGAIKGTNEAIQGSAPIQPGDEQVYPDSIPRNWLINKLGLPEGWKQSTADEKQYWQNFPQTAGTGMIGSVSTAEAQLANKFGTTTASKFAEAADNGFGKTVLANEPVQPVGKVAISFADLMRQKTLENLIKK